MAFRKVARRTEVFAVHWGDGLRVLPWTEDATEDIAQFLLSTGTQSFAELEECTDGTLDSARRYVTRARNYMLDRPGADVGYAASSLAYDTNTGRMIAACLCCGPSVYFIEVHPDYGRQGLATKMLKHALSVHAAHGVAELHLWRTDESPGAKLYEDLGFMPTGEIE